MLTFNSNDGKSELALLKNNDIQDLGNFGILFECFLLLTPS